MTKSTSVTTATEQLREQVTAACNAIAQSWPMKTFAYRNPLRGWESLPFGDSIRKAKHLPDGSGYAEQRWAAFVLSQRRINLGHFSEVGANGHLRSNYVTES